MALGFLCPIAILAPQPQQQIVGYKFYILKNIIDFFNILFIRPYIFS